MLEKLKDIAKPVKLMLQLILLAMTVIALYEFIYNFSIWSSFITHNMIKGKYNMDSISVPYPHPKTPWNIIFATKMTLAALLISSHGFYIMSKAIKKSITIVITSNMLCTWISIKCEI